jgi:carbon-monoxide dehydrogenase large subunit
MDTSRFLTGTLKDDGIPRADTLLRVTVNFSPVANVMNPRGVKCVGEGGTVAITPTVINAVLDGLALLGVADMPVPATPERIWSAVREYAYG